MNQVHTGGEGVKVFLDCEFTQLNRDTKLISLALVSEAGHEYYVELTDTYLVGDCSDFVIQNVLPQLDSNRHGRLLASAQAAMKSYLDSFEEELEICSDAPDWDWRFCCQLAGSADEWPSNVANEPTNLIHLFRHLEGNDLGEVDLPELPHHALLDARLLADLYQQLRANPA